MYFSTQDRGVMSAMVYNWPHDEVDVIVVTDGSRVLGLGDLGANGMQVRCNKTFLCNTHYANTLCFSLARYRFLLVN